MTRLPRHVTGGSSAQNATENAASGTGLTAELNTSKNIASNTVLKAEKYIHTVRHMTYDSMDRNYYRKK